MTNNVYFRKSAAASLGEMEIEIQGFGIDHKVSINQEHRERLDLSLAFSDCAFEELQNWDFVVFGINNSESSFITSDNPVSIFNPENPLTPEWVEFEYGNPKNVNISNENTPISESEMSARIQFQITIEKVFLGKGVAMIFPVSPNLCILGFSDGEGRARYERNPEIHNTNFVNFITFNQCNKEVYSHSKKILEKTWAYAQRVEANIQDLIK